MLNNERNKENNGSSFGPFVLCLGMIFLSAFAVYLFLGVKEENGKSTFGNFFQNMYDSIYSAGDIQIDVQKKDSTTIISKYRINSIDTLLHKGYIFGFKFDFTKETETPFVLDVFVKQDDNHYVRIRDGLLLEKTIVEKEYRDFISWDNRLGKEDNGNKQYNLYEHEFKLATSEEANKLLPYLQDKVYWDKITNDIDKNENHGSGGYDIFFIP